MKQIKFQNTNSDTNDMMIETFKESVITSFSKPLEMIMSVKEKTSELIKASFNKEECSTDDVLGCSLEVITLNNPIPNEEGDNSIVSIVACGENKIAIALENNQVYLYENTNNANTLTKPVFLTKESSKVTFMCYNTWSNCLCIVNELSQTVRVVKLNKKEVIPYDTNHTSTIKSVAFSGSWLITSSCDGSINFGYHEKDGTVTSKALVSAVFNKTLLESSEVSNSMAISDDYSTLYISGKRFLRKVKLEESLNTQLGEMSKFKIIWNSDATNTHEISSVKLFRNNFYALEVVSLSLIKHTLIIRNLITNKVFKEFNFAEESLIKEVFVINLPSKTYEFEEVKILVQFVNNKFLITEKITFEISKANDELADKVNGDISSFIEDFENELNEIDRQSSTVKETNSINHKEKKDSSNKHQEKKDKKDKDKIDLPKKEKRVVKPAKGNNSFLETMADMDSEDDSTYSEHTEKSGSSVSEEGASLAESVKNKSKKDKKKKKNKEQLHSVTEMSEDDMLGLSDLEKSDGELKNPSEIELGKEEKVKRKEMMVESRADKIIDAIPQSSFVCNSTQFEENNFRFLCFNMIGSVILRNEGEIKTIECMFSDISNKRKLVFSLAENISIAALNNCGLVLASKPEEQNIDEYENENKTTSCSTLMFKTIQLISTTIDEVAYSNDWEVKFGSEEGIENLALGVNWIAVYTDLNNFYIYSLSGILKSIFTVSYHAICMAGYENLLVYVYHLGPPLLGSQSLGFKILDSNRNFETIYEGPLPITPFSYLSWIGFSEEGMLFSYDSEKVLRHFSFNLGKNWIPMLNISTIYNNCPNTNFWVVGVQDGEIYGVELKNGFSEPTPFPKPNLKSYKIKTQVDTIGITKQDDLNPEEKVTKFKIVKPDIFTNKVFVEHENWRKKIYSFLKDTRSARSGEYYYSENVKSDEEIRDLKRNNDMAIMELFKNALLKKNYDQATDLLDLTFSSKIKRMAVTFSNKMDHHQYAQFLEEKLNKEELYKSTLDALMAENEHNSNNINEVNRNNKFNNFSHSENPKKDDLSNFAINMNKLRHNQTETLKDHVENNVKKEILGREVIEEPESYHSNNIEIDDILKFQTVDKKVSLELFYYFINRQV